MRILAAASKMFPARLASATGAAALLWAAPALPAAAGEPVLLQGFGNSARCMLQQEFATLSPDRATLRIDTTKCGGPWTPVFRTAPGMLKPFTTYEASFRCRVENPDMNSKFLCFISRPLSTSDGSADTLFEKGGGSSAFRPVKVKFRTGRAADYAFQIHTFQKLRGEITDFRLVERREGERFYPARRNAAPWSGTFGKLPAGAQEFEVDLPRNPEGKTVDAADFGLSCDATDNVGALNRALEYCRRIGAAKLTVAPGTYRLTADTPVRFDRMRDFTFDGGGATFVYSKKR